MLEINFDVKKTLQNRLATSLGLNKYKYIIDQVHEINISENTDFQKTFNGFYIVRRNETWRKIYYEYFESIKATKPTFREIITYIYEKTGNIEPSFSSKMLATLCSEKPIWDRYIVQNLNLKLTGKTQQEKLENAIKLYDSMEKWYSDFLQTAKAKECVEVFDNELPDYKWLSDIKKIDAILWSIR